MPANTPRGFPYPLPAEPVAEGAQAIRNLAEAIDAKDSGHELAYAEFTAPVAITGTTEAAAQVVATCPAVVLSAPQLVVVEFFAMAVQPAAVVGATIAVYLYNSGAGLGTLGIVRTPAASAMYQPVSLRRRLNLAAGTHTFQARASGSAAGTIYAGAGGAGANVPGFLRAIVA